MNENIFFFTDIDAQLDVLLVHFFLRFVLAVNDKHYSVSCFLILLDLIRNLTALFVTRTRLYSISNIERLVLGCIK